MCFFQIAFHIEERVHTTPGVKSGRQRVRDYFSQKEKQWLKKWSLPNFYLRTPRVMDSGHWHGSCPSCQVLIGTKVWVQRIEKGFLTPQPLLHMKNGKKVQKYQYWDIYTKEVLRPEYNGI